jgi:polyhydroxybutyrate depolymerase
VGVPLGARSRALAALAALLALACVTLPACRKKKNEPSLTTIEGASEILPAARAAVAATGATRTGERTLEVGGRTRSYLLVAPAALEPARRYPLVLVFHGDGGSAASFHQGFPFERASGDAAFLAYPDGDRATWDLESRPNPDVLFAETLIRVLATELPIDAERVFATGYSSGGFLANVIACQKSGLLRAIASNAGGAPYKQATKWPNGYPRCPGQEPIAAMALHGRRDFGVTIDSGRFSAEYWAYVNGCAVEAMETTGYPECRAYRGCPAGKAVVFCDVPELGHWVWDRAAEASWTFFLRQ